MVVTLPATKPVDYAVMGAAGASQGLGWAPAASAPRHRRHRRRRRRSSPNSAARPAFAGLAALASLAACLYTVPWRRAARGALKATRSFTVLWRGRAALALLSAAWALAQLLRVSRLWGANSLIFGPGVTAWTGAGWICRCASTVQPGAAIAA